jgi:glycosyltransferase involved in cell wall biosynthesis
LNLLYAFPEPLPLPRARGIQAVHTVAALAATGVDIDFSYVPAGEDPFLHYAIAKPGNVKLVPLSRSLPWPLARVHSNRLYAARLNRRFDLGQLPVMVRHLKLAAWLADHPKRPQLLYEAHEVFADTATQAQSAERHDEEERVMRSAAAVVANSAATARRLVELYGNTRILEIIPNGVARPDVLPEKDWTHPGKRIVYAGSLFPWKGAADLVAAASSLPGCDMEIIGGEPSSIQKLQALAPRSGAKIRFTGHLPHAQALQRVLSACIAVLPNRPDTDSAFTSPIKLFEYMAAGCAIVVSDLPPMREILDEGDAMWTMPGDPQSIAAAIAALVKDPDRARRLGEKVRAKSTQFTWQARAAQLHAVLASMGKHR